MIALNSRARFQAGFTAGQEAVARWAYMPAFSRDGRRLAFRDRGGLYVIATAGGSPLELRPPVLKAESRVTTGSACWSPDGAWIAYSDGPMREASLWKISAAGGRPVSLVRSNAKNTFGTACSWSPDGRLIVYGGNNGLRVVGQDGTGDQLVPGVAREGVRPARFLPNGELLVLNSEDGKLVLDRLAPGTW